MNLTQKYYEIQKQIIALNEQLASLSTEAKAIEKTWKTQNAPLEDNFVKIYFKDVTVVKEDEFLLLHPEQKAKFEKVTLQRAPLKRYIEEHADLFGAFIVNKKELTIEVK